MDLLSHSDVSDLVGSELPLKDQWLHNRMREHSLIAALVNEAQGLQGESAECADMQPS